MKVVIVGAGIGGLAAALCLQKAGHQITVVEQAPALVDVGAGLQCSANAVHVLSWLGVVPQLLKYAVKPEAVHFRDSLSGKRFHNMQLGESYEAQYGAPYLHIHRADLIEVLAARLSEKSSGELQLNSKVTAIEDHGPSVSVILNNGTTFGADCVIAADGIRSAVRQQLFEAAKPAFTGNVAWRTTIDTNKLSANFMATLATNFVGANKHMVMYYLRNRTLLNVVGVVENPHWSAQSWMAKAPKSELLDDFKGWHPMVIEAIDASDEAGCYRWALYDHQPIKQWSEGRVALLGDAAHAVLPFMASGAAMAIEDARILQRCLDAESDVPKALQNYQRNRLERTTKLQKKSRQVGKIYHINQPWLRAQAMRWAPKLSPSSHRFLPEYDANTIPLI